MTGCPVGEFQRTVAATGNERRPTVERRNDGTRSEWVDDDQKLAWLDGLQAELLKAKKSTVYNYCAIQQEKSLLKEQAFLQCTQKLVTETCQKRTVNAITHRLPCVCKHHSQQNKSIRFLCDKYAVLYLSLIHI